MIGKTSVLFFLISFGFFAGASATSADKALYAAWLDEVAIESPLPKSKAECNRPSSKHAECRTVKGGLTFYEVRRKKKVIARVRRTPCGDVFWVVERLHPISLKKFCELMGRDKTPATVVVTGRDE